MIRRGTGRRGGQAELPPPARLTVSRTREHVHVVHTGGTPPRRLADLADRLGPARENEAAVLVGAPLGDDGAEGLCERLAPVLRGLKDEDVRLLRLVMSAGADEAEDRPSVARLICERWELDVLATAGPAVVVPDGTLFSPDLPDAPGGWWHFSYGEVPRPVGSRLPIPAWESALRQVDHDPVAGHVVEPVPAGLLIRSTAADSPAVHTLPYAVPPDPDRPYLLVGTADVPAGDLATVLAALPGRIREDIRLLSLDGQPMPETGQAVADLLGTDVHLANGLPVVVDGDPDDGSRAEASTEPYLVDADGTPAWRPFARTLTCAPVGAGRAENARVTTWRAPASLSSAEPVDVALPFHRIWKVAPTPAGLWIGPRSGEPPLTAVTRRPAPDAVAIELGAPRRALDDSLWPHLDRLFGELDPEVRERAVVHVHGVLGSRGMESLRKLTVRHSFSLMPQRRGGGAEEPLSQETEAAEEATEPEPEPESEPGLRPSVRRPVEVVAPARELRTQTGPSTPERAPEGTAPLTATATATTTATATATVTTTATATVTATIPASPSPASPSPASPSPAPGASDSDPAKLRRDLGPFWEQHRRAATDVVAPLFRAAQREQPEATVAELVAVHVYMTAVDDVRLRASLADGDDRSRTLLRCLRSATRRLPSYRGASLSTADELVSRVTADAVGQEWEGTVPVRAVAVGRTYPGVSTDHVLIWSVTGRRTGTLDADGAEHVLFAQESRFRVLGVARHGTATVGLMQEMPQESHVSAPRLEAALLKRLRAVFDLLSAAPGTDLGRPLLDTVS
ncbi:hypothetical protein [Streptomyces sp. NPDC003247]|uniref:hypothetical protein n=1 Tax=Streptomyces sp. NPDC003247 TaxID=3364677 RepID=UPI0036A4287E